MAVILHQQNLVNLDATQELAAKLAGLVNIGDVLLLEGDIGAGKTSFARAFIHCLMNDKIDVPSPTYTIVQTYDANICDVWHCDLYRLTHPDEAFELGLNDAFEGCITLIEWPDRLGELAPEELLTIKLTALGDSRNVTIFGTKSWQNRLASFDG